MDSLIETFHIDWKTVIAQMVNFGIVFSVLYFFAFKPIKKIMDEREKKISKGLEDAKNNAEIIKKSKEDYEKVITEAKMEANNLFQKGKKEAEAKKSEMLEQAKKEVETLIQTGKKTLEIEKNKMVDEAKNEIVSLVVSATEKILKEKDGGIDDKIINKISQA